MAGHDGWQAQRDVYSRTLLEIVRRDSRHVVLDGDLANSTKVDLIAEHEPGHFFQMGIAEQNMVGVAAGMASCGLVPWVNTFTVFLVKRSLDQIRMTIAQTKLNVKLVGSYSGILTGFTGKTHQSVEDIAIMRAMPNMTVLAPVDAQELAACVRFAADYDGPVYLRIHRDPGPAVLPKHTPFVHGHAVVLGTGTDVTLISTGEQTGRVVSAAELLAREGIISTVLHIPTIKPLDVQTIVAAADRTDRVVVVEEHSIYGGLGGAVCEALSEHRPTLTKRIGLQDVYGESAPNEALLEKYGLSPERIAGTVTKWLQRVNQTTEGGVVH